MTEPLWVEKARRLIGVAEIPGPRHSAEVLQMWRDIRRGGIKDDETPWCAAFVGAMLERCGIRSSRFESAKSYAEWGEPVDIEAVPAGAVAVFTRKGGGHVGFVVGRTPAGDLLILGGNQSNAVNVRVFSPDRLSALRWPEGVRHGAPLLAAVSVAPVSLSEA
ncbi:hypothetical protein D3C78_412320 [compost metagenome]